MKRLLILALLFVPFSASAQSFGEVFPVTNTRYPPALGAPQLSTNGRDFFLFWSADGKTRAAKFQDGFARGSHVVLDLGLGDITWTGDRFLAVSSRTAVNKQLIVIRRLDAEAHPVSPELTIAENGYSPQIAAGRNSALLTYRSYAANETRALLIGRDGSALGGESRIIAPGASTHALASNGDGFLAAMAVGEGIRTVALDQNGQTIGDNTFPRTNTFRYVDVASDGSKYVAVWCDESEVAIATLTENGTFGSPLVIDNSTMNQGLLRARVPTVVWNGAGWTVSYEASGASVQSRARIVQLDRSAQRILMREESAIGIGSPTTAAIDGRIIAAWRPNGQSSSASVVELPLAENTPQSASYAAAQQKLLATASSADGTLIVWSEKIEGGTSVHAGVRSHDGHWNERKLVTVTTSLVRALAASDGNQFAVALIGSTSSLFRLDADGRPIAGAMPLPLHPSVMGWNGTNYALLNSYQGVLLDRSGQLSAPVALSMDFDFTALASDGNGFFVAGEVMDCPFILCYPVEMRGVRLGPDLKRIDTNDLILSGEDESGQRVIGAGWNGTEYVLLWSDDSGGNKITHVPPSRAYPIRTQQADAAINGESMTVMRDGSIAVTGRDYAGYADAKSRVVFLSDDGVALRTFEIERSANVLEKPRLEPRPDGGVAYIASSVGNAAPHDGTSHVVMSIARPSPTPPPSAPHVSARLQNGSIVIDWSASAGTINGYRLEYRVDDDSWNEYEQWFSPSAQRKTIRQPSFGTQFAFRMRAFNDGGASAYSATAVTKPSRRRAVR